MVIWGSEVTPYKHFHTVDVFSPPVPHSRPSACLQASPVPNSRRASGGNLLASSWSLPLRAPVLRLGSGEAVSIPPSQSLSQRRSPPISRVSFHSVEFVYEDNFLIV